MEENKPIDGAEYISLQEAKHLKLPYFEGAAAGFPSPASDYQHESLDLNEKFVHHPEAPYFVRVKGESMIGLGIIDGDICLADRWMMLGAAMGIQECGTEGFDMFAMMRGWTMARE